MSFYTNRPRANEWARPMPSDNEPAASFCRVVDAGTLGGSVVAACGKRWSISGITQVEPDATDARCAACRGAVS